jgi:hypothetical protein
MNTDVRRPKEVKLAVMLQLFVIFAAWAVLLARLLSTTPAAVISYGFPYSVVLGIMLICAIYLGQNWARVLFLILWLLAVLAIPLILM